MRIEVGDSRDGVVEVAEAAEENGIPKVVRVAVEGNRNGVVEVGDSRDGVVEVAEAAEENGIPKVVRVVVEGNRNGVVEVGGNRNCVFVEMVDEANLDK